MKTKRRNNVVSITQIAAPDAEVNERKIIMQQVERLDEHLAELRHSLEFIGLNMHKAFGGALRTEHANAYHSLVAAQVALYDAQEIRDALIPNRWLPEAVRKAAGVR
jgi:hypothetical protein